MDSFPVCGCLLFALLLTISGAQNAFSSTGLVASINSGGLQGNVEFIQNPSGKGVAIRVFLRGGTYGEKFRWKIHEFPALLGMSAPCGEEKIGRMFVDLTETHGPLTSGQDISLTSETVKLSGPLSINGRTLVLRSSETGRLACSVIQPTSRIRTFWARLRSGVGGEVILRQSVFGTSIFSQLYYVDGTRKDTVHRWALVRTSDRVEQDATVLREMSRCSGLETEPVLPLSETVGYAAVGRAPNAVTGRTYYTLATVAPLEEVPGDLYMLVYSDSNPSQVLACAHVETVEPRQALARFEKEVSGEISFRQESPFDPTLVTVNLADLNKKAYSFGVDELPLLFRDKSEVCPNVKGVIYNPLKVVPDGVPEPGKGSADQYATGDLSGKYGTLHMKEKHFQQIYDPQLSLFGVHSVVGRAVVVYYPDGRPLACANVDVSGRRQITAFSTFDFPLQGQVILRQDRDSVNSDTSVYLELSYPTGTADKKTYNHPWHVHERPVTTGQQFSSTDCDQAGPHFNPYNVTLNSVYTCHCSGKSASRCELGDTSGKLGYLDIPPYLIQNNKQQIARYFFTDPHLPLSGPTSVIGRSLVVHSADFGDPRLVCANILMHSSAYGK